jgi:hypothetical protein
MLCVCIAIRLLCLAFLLLLVLECVVRAFVPSVRCLVSFCYVAFVRVRAAYARLSLAISLSLCLSLSLSLSHALSFGMRRRMGDPRAQSSVYDYDSICAPLSGHPVRYIFVVLHGPADAGGIPC